MNLKRYENYKINRYQRGNIVLIANSHFSFIAIAG